jgi:hypothetical protein
MSKLILGYLSEITNQETNQENETRRDYPIWYTQTDIIDHKLPEDELKKVINHIRVHNPYVENGNMLVHTPMITNAVSIRIDAIWCDDYIVTSNKLSLSKKSDTEWEYIISQPLVDNNGDSSINDIHVNINTQTIDTLENIPFNMLKSQEKQKLQYLQDIVFNWSGELYCTSDFVHPIKEYHPIKIMYGRAPKHIHFPNYKFFIAINDKNECVNYMREADNKFRGF